MDSHCFSLKWLPLLVAAMLMVFAVAAQPPATNGWQHIIFSSPDNTQISSNLTSVASQPSSSAFESKLQLFQDSSPVAAFATPPLSAAPAPMPTRMRRSQQSSEDNLPWEFMTPAEILGVASDQIFQTQKKDAQGNQGSLTPMERYLQGQSSFAQFRTNSAGNSFRGQNLWANGNDQTNNASTGLFSSAWGNMQSNVSSPFMGNTPADNWSGGPKGDSVWQKMFGTPASHAAFNPDQPQSDMSQFMQLLNPSSTPDTTATAPEDTPSFKPQTAWPNSDSTAPLANPFGASVAPLSSGISQPAGLAPLPSLIRPAAVQPAAPPAWAPQPPPWLSSTPQPFAIPQRKF
jgi:hypothetical protein